MEGSDAFAQTTEIDPENDPFAGSAFGDFERDEDDTVHGEAVLAREQDAEEHSDTADLPVDTTDLPVVDREGQRIEPENEGGTPEGTPSPLQEVAQEPPALAEAPPEPPAEASAAPEAAAVPQEPQDDVPDPADGFDDPIPADLPGLDATPVPEPEPDDAPEPETPAAAAGKTTMRKYVILQVDAPGKFSQVAWHVDDHGKIAKKAPGTKRQTVALCRSIEDALKIGFMAVGSPPEGTTLIAVAALYFQPKPVAPIPQEPARQRLKIG